MNLENLNVFQSYIFKTLELILNIFEISIDNFMNQVSDINSMYFYLEWEYVKKILIAFAFKTIYFLTNAA